MPSVHDNVILSYRVDLQNDQIIIYTEYDNSRIVKETDIIFTDVFGHRFEQPLKGSIILCISESPISSFVEGNSELLLKSKDYGWPAMFESLEELQQVLIEGDYKYIDLMSSYGMNGWVVAKNYEYVTRVIKG